MSKARPAPSRKTAQTVSSTPAPKVRDEMLPYRLALWAVFFGTSVFLWPSCIDRYLAPRFFFLSLALLGSLVLLWRELKTRGDRRLQGFDLLLLAWYGLNAASITWAFNWSEAVFFTQKALLLFGSYWLFRQALLRDESILRRTLQLATVGLTLIIGAIIIGQLAIAVPQYGLNNEALYDFASGVSGNKGLASDFLFFLLIFNALFYAEFVHKKLFWCCEALLLALIVVLQTRTVYLAVAAAALLYFPGRAVIDRDFRRFFLKKLLPVGLTGFVLLVGFVAWKGRGNSIAERLNPATYLESASAKERRFVWYKTDLLNAEHYWWGVGNGSWKIWMPSKSVGGSYRLEEKNIIFTRAHNDYLEVRAEMGIVGATLFTGLFIAAFISLLFAKKPDGDAPASAPHHILIVGAGLLGYCIIQYFDFPRERLEMQMVLGFLFAWAVHLGRRVWSRLPGLDLGKLFPAFLLLLLVGLAFNLVIGWSRISGEIHNLKLLKAQASNHPAEVLREAHAAENPFYEYNDVVLPLQWYEGIIHFQQNNFDKSVEAFARAYELNPWSFQVINNYAAALTKAEHYPEAIALFEKAININPRYDEGKFNLSYAWYQLGDFNKSLEWLSRIDTIPNPQTAEEREKNKSILKRQAEFRRSVEEKMNGN